MLNPTSSSSSSYSFGSTSTGLVSLFHDIIETGSTEITHQMNEIFKKHNCSVLAQTESLPSSDPSNPKEKSYLRDPQVINLSGLYLIPAPFKNPKAIADIFPSVLFPKSDTFIKNPHNAVSGYGRGFGKDNVDATVEHCKRHGQVYRIMRCPLEGGHIFFLHGNKVIVGLTSLSLSFLRVREALITNENGFFKEGEREGLKQAEKSIVKPKKMFVYIARNMDLRLKRTEDEQNYKTLRESADNNLDDLQLQRQADEALTKIEEMYGQSEEKFIDILISKVTDNDINTFKGAARKIQAQFGLASKIMADSLEVAPKNLMTLVHDEFHLDMRMNVFPDGKRVMLDQSMKWADDSIKKMGCEVLIVNGVTEDTNLMNGIFVRSPKRLLYITNSFNLKDKEFFERFRKQLEPYCQVIAIEGTENMAKIEQAGIHCITRSRENFTKAGPVSIIRSYLIDEPCSGSREDQQLAIAEALSFSF